MPPSLPHPHASAKDHTPAWYYISSRQKLSTARQHHKTDALWQLHSHHLLHLEPRVILAAANSWCEAVQHNTNTPAAHCRHIKLLCFSFLKQLYGALSQALSIWALPASTAPSRLRRWDIFLHVSQPVSFPSSLIISRYRLLHVILKPHKCVNSQSGKSCSCVCFCSSLRLRELRQPC